jgi:hypothetical protein
VSVADGPVLIWSIGTGVLIYRSIILKLHRLGTILVQNSECEAVLGIRDIFGADQDPRICTSD